MLLAAVVTYDSSKKGKPFFAHMLLASAVVTCDSKKKEHMASSLLITLESVAQDKRQLLAKVFAVKMQVFASSFDVGGAFVDSYGN